jgi:hypothetical protein
MIMDRKMILRALQTAAFALCWHRCRRPELLAALEVLAAQLEATRHLQAPLVRELVEVRFRADPQEKQITRGSWWTVSVRREANRWVVHWRMWQGCLDGVKLKGVTRRRGTVRGDWKHATEVVRLRLIAALFQLRLHWVRGSGRTCEPMRQRDVDLLHSTELPIQVKDCLAAGTMPTEKGEPTEDDIAEYLSADSRQPHTVAAALLTLRQGSPERAAVLERILSRPELQPPSWQVQPERTEA